VVFEEKLRGLAIMSGDWMGLQELGKLAMVVVLRRRQTQREGDGWSRSVGGQELI